MSFCLSIIEDDSLTARLTHNGQSSDIQLAYGFWTADDYRAHWGFTAYDLLDYWKTKFLILEARPTGSPETCRAFRVSRISDRFHFHDVLIAAPSSIGDYAGESLIDWLSRPRTPFLASGRPGHGPERVNVIDEFIVEHEDFVDWQVEELDGKMPDNHRGVDELTAKGDWA